MSPPIAFSRHTRGSRARAGRRALFLAVVWILPGVWCTGHTLLHELDDGHLLLEAAFEEDRLVGMSGDHDHGHTHPDTPPVLSTEGGKKLEGPALLTSAGKLEAPRVSRPRHDDAAIGRFAGRAASVSGPRAPPIS